MEKILKQRINTKAAICLMVFLLFIAASGMAQEERDSTLNIYSEIEFEYTDNVYRLTDDQIATMKENNPDDIISGRYNGMDALTDYIIKPRIRIRWNSDSLFGGEFRLAAWLRYNYYLKNDDSSFTEGSVILRNSIGGSGYIIFEGNLLYGFKKKNYLSAVSDMNGNRNIARQERTYTAAIYDEYEGIIGYRYEFIKDKDSTISQFYIKPFAGYSNRTYNSCFVNRDKSTAFGGLELGLEFIDRVDLEITYEYENISSPDGTEIVLFDETRSGTDVNNDGSIKKNAPLSTNIDRSSDRYSFEINPSIKLAKDIKLFLGYSKRTSEYSSDNQLDIEHYNQIAHRKKYKSGIGYDISKSWSAEVEYRRKKDEDPEDGVYKENSYLFTIEYKF